MNVLLLFIYLFIFVFDEKKNLYGYMYAFNEFIMNRKSLTFKLTLAIHMSADFSIVL